MSHRAGLSRAEVVVALLLVVVAGGLLIPAIGRVRGEAARQSCQNNLKQHAIAVHNYASAYDRLPQLVDLGDGATTGKGLPSAFALLTPYIEASPGYYRQQMTPTEYAAHSSVPFSFDNKDGTIGTLTGGVANRTWRVFTDPADATASNLRDVPVTLPDGTTGYYATGSYALNGMVPWGGEFRTAFPGGAANTVLIAERPQVCRPASGDPVYNLWGVGFYSPHMPAFATLTPADPPGLWSTGQLAPVTPLPADPSATILYRTGFRDSAPHAADFATPIQLIRNDRPCDPRLPGTPHRSGMNVAMADGSVRVLAPDTSPGMFWVACGFQP